MAKKSFIIYQNWAEIIKRLPTEDAGELIKAVCCYETGEKYETDNPYVDAIFEGQIKPQLDKDAEKYAKEVEKRSEAGKKGMKSRWGNNTPITNDNTVITNDNNVINPITNDNTTITKITDTDTVTENIKEKDSPTENRKRKPPKHKYGEYGHVMLSDRDVELLYQNHGEEETKAAIDYLDKYMEEKGYKTQNHKMTIERWVFDAVKKNGNNRASPKATKFTNFEERNYNELDTLENQLARN